MLETLANLPFLTILLVLFLIRVGVRAIKPRSIRYRQLYILPCVFLVISANQLLNTYPLSVTGLLAWTTATLIAGVISWRIAENTAITIDRDQDRISLPGTWITLTLIIAFIAARLYFGRQLYVTPALKTDPGFIAQILLMSGIITGYYLGRSGSFLKRFFTSHLHTQT